MKLTLILLCFALLTACLNACSEQAGPGGLIDSQPSHDVYGTKQAASEFAQSMADSTKTAASNTSF